MDNLKYKLNISSEDIINDNKNISFKNSKYIGEIVHDLVITNCLTNDIVMCQCKCGKEFKIKIVDLFTYNRKELVSNNILEECNCNTFQYISRSREYRIWNNIKQRCYNANNDSFIYYGERGIEMCSKWKNSFSCFISDMGFCPDGYSIDRLDTNKGYYKENCRWATSKQQNNNKRNNKYIQFQGRIQTIREWCTELKLDYAIVMYRIYKQKYSVEKAFYRKDLINNTRHHNSILGYTPANQKSNYNNNEFKNKL